MLTGSRAICLLMALLAVVSEFVAAAFGHEAKPSTLADDGVFNGSAGAGAKAHWACASSRSAMRT